MAHRLSCSVACGIFPDQGSNLCPLHWQADSQPLRHQGSPSDLLLMNTMQWKLTLILNLAHKRQYSSLLALLLRTSTFRALSLQVRSLATMKPLCWKDYTEIGRDTKDPQLFQLLPIWTSLLKCHACESGRKPPK